MLQQTDKNNVPRRLLLVLLFIFHASLLRAEPPVRVKQGQMVHLSVTTETDVDKVIGHFRGQPIPFFKNDKGTFTTLIGIDMDQEIGALPFVVAWKSSKKDIRREYSIVTLPASFAIQELTLPKGKVDLDPPTLVRVRREQKLMKNAFSENHTEKLWKGKFIVPVEGKKQGTFGRRRILNGQPRRSHTGEDISAPEGAIVSATNSGQVVLVGDYFFNGRSVVIDHGLGLFSMYFHLLDIAVAEGERIEKGDTIGRVGQSGRVTGPHLHWGMRLNGARIDPFALTKMQFD